MTVILIYLFVESVDTTSVDRRWWRLYLFICLLSSLTRGDDGYLFSVDRRWWRLYLFICLLSPYDKCWSKGDDGYTIRQVLIEGDDGYTYLFVCWRWYDKCWSKVMTLFICLLSPLIRRQVLIEGDDGYTYLFVCWVRWHDKCWSKVMTVILIYLFVEFVDTTSVDRRWWRLYLFICLLSPLTRQVLIVGDDGYTYLFVCWVRWHDKCWS